MSNALDLRHLATATEQPAPGDAINLVIERDGATIVYPMDTATAWSYSGDPYDTCSGVCEDTRDGDSIYFAAVQA